MTYNNYCEVLNSVLARARTSAIQFSIVICLRKILWCVIYHTLRRGVEVGSCWEAVGGWVAWCVKPASCDSRTSYNHHKRHRRARALFRTVSVTSQKNFLLYIPYKRVLADFEGNPPVSASVLGVDSGVQTRQKNAVKRQCTRNGENSELQYGVILLGFTF